MASGTRGLYTTAITRGYSLIKTFTCSCSCSCSIIRSLNSKLYSHMHILDIINFSTMCPKTALIEYRI